ncbi:biopolymer transportern ExbD [Aurantiacibacter atlanticus]|uniref:Biopolymer transportern ExbD n=1 Tax=Aurantiacibacter atlanticus TaxID=1648404 RepID=A0A0H4V9B8_9SPHN|nr:biopolymer transporter ExbD [Aurantiacibacter atlanticus]AKQ41182.1 biopolymer transportern ExbD [Aurantiacibacter atlanticus]MDF1835225.1 biopolymer transporter ExbD [Alteraurantiacibacter sp. bin_em_oilr2.035]
MAMAGGSDDGEPMMEMNMTPLIDVLLVLLIMFIITIPIATHAVNIDLPSPTNDPSTPDVDPVTNKIVLTRENVILWNDTPISQNELVYNLSQSLDLAVEPELQFEPEANASYDLAATVLDIIKRSGVTRFGFVGNDKYRQFGS